MFIYKHKPNLIGFMVDRLIRFVKKFIYGPRRVVADDLAKAGKSRLGSSNILLRLQKLNFREFKVQLRNSACISPFKACCHKIRGC